jgi:hypothetical protein
MDKLNPLLVAIGVIIFLATWVLLLITITIASAGTCWIPVIITLLLMLFLAR